MRRVALLEKFLSHFRAIKIIEISSDLMARHTLRKEQGEEVVDHLEKTGDRLIKVYHKFTKQLEDGGSESQEFVSPSLDGMNSVKLNELKKQVSKLVSDIDKELAKQNSNSSK